jgi:cobalt-zinc-cadmium efflux system membrane fusion protein
VPAEIQFDPDRVAHINTLVDGQIVTVRVTVGDQVQAGDQLATFRSAVLGEARAEFTRATAARDAARVTLERQQRLREEGISSERNLLQARLAFDEADAARNAARSRLRALAAGGGSGAGQALRSPIDGVVIERHATRGENVSPEDTLFVIADASEVWVIGRLYEQHIGLVRRGAAATLTTGAHPDRQWTGVVDYVAISMDETSRTLPVRISVVNSDQALRPGMFGTLSLGGNTDTAAALAVPLSAVQSLEGQGVIFVAGVSARTFEARTVELGHEAEGNVAVLDGLSSNDRIVVEGGFILKSELIRGQLGHGCAGD